MTNKNLIPCVGCGAPVPDTDGPTHRYIGASPGCWQIYTELQVVGYGTPDAPAFGEWSRIMVDTYAAQHPGVPGKQSSQSVAAHLVILCLVLEHNLQPARATEAITRFLDKHKSHGFDWVEPPPSLGPLTILHVPGAANASDHNRRVREWAESVWQAWQPYHPRIRSWANELK